ncbi:MAG TPA: sigma-70 family RNA polymerase sigma factor [Actinomycetota bacterium]|nr:sigma-70 family RNA polymerase sigma factor [Actinomycetota bacterium]
MRVGAESAGEDERMTAPRTFEALFEAERDGLFGALVLITGDRHEAEELAQDAFLAVWERWDRVGAMDNPTGYLYRTAMNVFRKRRRRAALAVRRAVGLIHAEDAFAAADARQMVARALAGLSRRQRAALVLTELLGFTSDEAGRALGITPVTVRVLASQGRATMKHSLERSDG